MMNKAYYDKETMQVVGHIELPNYVGGKYNFPKIRRIEDALGLDGDKQESDMGMERINNQE